MKKNLLVFIILLVSIGIFAQNEPVDERKHNQVILLSSNTNDPTNNGILFTPEPTLINSAFIPGRDNEGISSITTANGKSILAASANRIYYSADAGSSYMELTSPVTNEHSRSSSQGSLILPDPAGNSNVYYVFFVAQLELGYSGSPGIMCYKLTIYNEPITTFGEGYSIEEININNINDLDRESIAACPIKGATGYWLITQSIGELNNSIFKIYRLTSSNPIPQFISFEEVIHNSYTLPLEMVFSPDMNMLAVSCGVYDLWEENKLKLYKFNRDINHIGNRLDLYYELNFGIDDFTGSFEFSPNGRYLYATTYKSGGANTLIKNLWQIEVDNPENIVNIFSGAFTDLAGEFEMTLGPDGKIYILLSDEGHIGRINNPDMAGTACNFDPDFMRSNGARYMTKRIPVLHNSFPVIISELQCSNELSVSNLTEGQNYTYLWNTGETTKNIIVQHQGTYSVTVSSASGQSVTSEYFFNGILDININSITDNCNETSIDYYIEGGIGPYNAELLLNNNIIDTWTIYNPKLLQSLSDLSAGNYKLMITDNNNCSKIIEFGINYNYEFEIIASKNPLCYGDSTTLTVNLIKPGGPNIPSFECNWNQGLGAGTSVNVAPIGDTYYSAFITDSNGCSTMKTIHIEVSSYVAMIVGKRSPRCGESDGKIMIDMQSMPNDAYSYLWNTGDTTRDLSNIPAGTYYLTLIDHFNCQTTHEIILTEKDGPQLSILDVTAQYDSNLGSVTLQKTNGTHFTLANSSQNYNINDLSDSLTISNLPYGLYTVTSYRDNCQDIKEFSIARVITNLTASCPNTSNGAIDLDITVFGEGNYLPNSMNWSASSPAFNKTSTLTQQSSQQYTTRLNNLSSRTYTYSVTDAKGNIINNTVNIESLSVPNIIVSNIKAQYDDYLGGITIQNADQSSLFMEIPMVNINNSTQVYNTAFPLPGGYSMTMLPYGLYTATATYSNGCKDVEEFSIARVITTKTTSCPNTADGNIELYITVYGTNNSLIGDIRWVPSATSSLILDPLYLSDRRSKRYIASLDNISAGTYTYSVIDAKLNLITNSVAVSEKANISINTIVANPASLFGTGSATITFSPSVSNYFLSVVNSSNVSYYSGNIKASSISLTNLPVGIYYITLTSPVGCVFTSQFTVLRPGIIIPLPTKQSDSEPFIEPGLNIYPNPTEDLINIEYNFFEDPENDCIERDMKLYTSDGKLVYSEKLQGKTGVRTLDISNYTPGIYMLQVIDCDGNYNNARVIKQ